MREIDQMARGFHGGPRRAEAVGRLLERDGDRCWYCGCEFGDGDQSCTVDHVLPVSQGGGNQLENLRLACSFCNNRRSNLRGGDYEHSKLLERRQRTVFRDTMIASGEWLPKQAFHHRSIEWLGVGRWTCSDCDQRSLDGAVSPASVPCAPWSNTPPNTWTRWWGNRTRRAAPKMA